MKFNCKRNYFIFLYFVWIFLVNNMMVDKIWWNLSSPVLIIYPMSVKKLEQENTWFLIFIELLILNMIYEYLIDKIQKLQCIYFCLTIIACLTSFYFWSACILFIFSPKYLFILYRVFLMYLNTDIYFLRIFEFM